MDQINQTVSSVSTTGLSGVAGALQGGLNTLLNSGKSFLDRFFPPEKRNEIWAKMVKFATERPKLASFLLSQIALSGIPLALFVVMSVTVFVFSLVGALVIGLVGALLFTVFCLGVALVIVLPTLFITSFAASFIWLWGLGAYYLLKWFNQKEIPGVHKPLGDGLKESILKDMPALDGQTTGTAPTPTSAPPTTTSEKPAASANGNGAAHEKKPSGTAKQAPKLEKRDHSNDRGKTTGSSVGNTVGDVRKKADIGNATKAVDGATGQLNGVKGAVPGGVL